MRWARHVARVQAIRNECNVLSVKLEMVENLGDLCLERKIMLN
jgi:hypothetical protein